MHAAAPGRQLHNLPRASAAAEDVSATGTRRRALQSGVPLATSATATIWASTAKDVYAGARTCCTASPQIGCACVSAWLPMFTTRMPSVTIAHEADGGRVNSGDGPWALILPVSPVLTLPTKHRGLTVMLAGNCINARPVGHLPRQHGAHASVLSVVAEGGVIVHHTAASKLGGAS